MAKQRNGGGFGEGVSVCFVWVMLSSMDFWYSVFLFFRSVYVYPSPSSLAHYRMVHFIPHSFPSSAPSSLDFAPTAVCCCPCTGCWRASCVGSVFGTAAAAPVSGSFRCCSLSFPSASHAKLTLLTVS